MWGGCLWRRRGGGDGRREGEEEDEEWKGGGVDVELLRNEELGYSLKSKRRGVDEMSVVKGYGCFDSCCLV